MPTISMFYGIIIRMYMNDHLPPHIHAFYGEYMALFTFNGVIIQGDFPTKQKKLVVAWISIHEDELKANWELASNKEELFKIDPLR